MLHYIRTQLGVSQPTLWDHVRARHISTGLNEAFCVSQDDPAQLARRRLEERGFDQAPILAEPNHVVGWVATIELIENDTVLASMISLEQVADETGTIMPGKRADIVVLAGDPFKLASLKENIRAVYSGGTQVRG